jgi:hypothetical protein
MIYVILVLVSYISYEDIKEYIDYGQIKKTKYPPRFPNHPFKLHQQLYDPKQVTWLWYECLKKFVPMSNFQTRTLPFILVCLSFLKNA